MTIKPIELEYQELISIAFGHKKLGIRIKTTPETYEQDFTELVIEVKKQLQELDISKRKKK